MDTTPAEDIKLLAYNLLLEHTPIGTELNIEETDQKLCMRYIIHLTYTSKRSQRKMTLSAKGDTLPTEEGQTLKYYLSQLVMTPEEVGRAFSRLYFYEKRAKQDAFLFGGGKARGNDVRVSSGESRKDSLNYDELA